MEFSLISSTSSSNNPNGSNNKHIAIAEKIHDISRRVKYARRIIKEEGVLDFGGFTNERVGPPTLLGEPHRTEWRKAIRNCANKCVGNYLLPAYIQKAEYYYNKVQKEIVEKVTDENRAYIERGIKLGRDRIDRKWDRREGIKKNTRHDVGPFEAEEIGVIKRGELKLTKGEKLGVSKSIKSTREVFKVLSHAIYGSGRYSKLITRNIWKFIQTHESREKSSFKPFLGNLNNNTVKWISTWAMFCAFIRNRDLKITTFELEIIGRLYDVRIQIFRGETNSLRCSWTSEYVTNREVNLFMDDKEEWSWLVKEKRSEHSDSSNRFAHLGVVEPEVSENVVKNKQLYDTIRTNSVRELEINSSYKEAGVGNDLEEFQEGDNRLTITTIVSEGQKQDKEREVVRNTRNYRKMIFWQKWRKKVKDTKRNIEKKREEKRKKESNRVKGRQLVFDYTSGGLSLAEIDFLSKGESFCVANHKVDLDRLKTDIFNYGRRLRLHDEFREPKTDSQQDSNSLLGNSQTQARSSRNIGRYSSNFSPITQTPSNSTGNTVRNTLSQNRTQKDRLGGDKDKVRKPASIYDPDSQNRNLNRYIQCIQEESLVIIKKKAEFKDNISVELREAMKTLIDKIEKKSIIITKADKGSGLVALDYDLYIKKGTKYIEEEAKAYDKVNEVDKNVIQKLVKARNNVVNNLKVKEVIEIETATYCNKQLEEKITGLKFYYKIHKDSNIQSMPLRPLQSCINAPTHHLSQVLTDILQPFLTDKYIPTYLQDSNQLLYRLGNLQVLSLEDTLISSDVAALYPSIPHVEGMRAMTEFLQTNSFFSEEQIGSIIRALKLVITQNYVVWNNQLYKQSSGVAMGTPVAVAYANIFMHWIDEEIRQKAPFIIKHYRYIDDNLFILPKNRIEELMQIANNILSPQIRFTYETLDRQTEVGLSFLDTLLFITEEGKIDSRLYTKKTDKHAYLLPTSYHPIHITKNIPQAVFNRIRRLCSREEWYQADASLAISWLEDRGYSSKDIKSAAEKSKGRNRMALINNIEEKRDKVRNSQSTEDSFKIPFLVTYSHPTLRIKEVLRQRQGLLEASFIKTKVKPRLTFRRQKNVSDIIVQKGLRGPITKKGDNILSLCGETPKYRIVCPCKGKHDQKICRCCAHMRIKVEGVRIKLYKQVDCDTKNIIYMIGCNLCKKRYIGETQQRLKERLLQHLNNISKLKQPLYIHFNQVHKGENLFITILETIKTGEAAYRKVREAWWINKMQTLEPRGFNVKLDCQQVYQASGQTLQLERDYSHNRRRFT